MKASLSLISTGLFFTILSPTNVNAMEGDTSRLRDPFLPPQNCSTNANEQPTSLGRWRLLGLIGENDNMQGWFSNNSRWIALKQGDRFYQTPFTISSFESNAAILQLDEQSSYRCSSTTTVRLAFTTRLKQHKEQYEINK